MVFWKIVVPRFVCPSCHAEYDLPQENEGRKARCGQCQTKSIVIFDSPDETITIASAPPALSDAPPPPSAHLAAKAILSTAPVSPAPTHPPPPAPNTQTVTAQPRKTSAKPLYRWLIIAIILAAGLPIYSRVRNSNLRHDLHSCPTYGIVKADVYYAGAISSDVVVFNFTGGSSNARRIDPVHLFLDFSGKLDLSSVRRVVLAKDGKDVFYISSPDLRPLANSYKAGGAIWAFNHLPENVRTMSGLRAYDEWSGGWLGVLQKQAEDLNEFIRDWTGY